MSRNALRAVSAVLALATAVVWLSLDSLAWSARLFTTILLVPLPAVLLLQARISDQIPEEMDREAVYFSSALSIWILAAFAMLAARFSGITRPELRLMGVDSGTLLAAAGLTVIAGLALMAAGRLLRLKESRLIAFLIPRTGSEKIAFIGLSLSAGVAEELVYRSFLIGALVHAGASLPLAVGASIAAFAAAHSYQGTTGVVRVALLGAVLTVPYLVTGSVYPSMIAHAALDVLAGLVLADWLMGPSDH